MNKVEYFSFYGTHPLFKSFKFSLYKIVKTSTRFISEFITDVYSNDVEVVKKYVLGQKYKNIICINYYGLNTYYVPKYNKFFNELSERELGFILQRISN